MQDQYNTRAVHTLEVQERANYAGVLRIDRGRLRRIVASGAPPTPPILAHVTAIEQSAGVQRQVVHGHVDAVQLAAGDVLHVAAHGRARGQQHLGNGRKAPQLVQDMDVRCGADTARHDSNTIRNETKRYDAPRHDTQQKETKLHDT